MKIFRKLSFLLALGILTSFYTLHASNDESNKTDVCRIDEFKITDKDGNAHLAIIMKEDITHTGTITILLPPMSDAEKKQLKPEIKMHDPKSATISPASGVAHDFTKQASYTVNCTNKKGKKLTYKYKVDVGAAKE